MKLAVTVFAALTGVVALTGCVREVEKKEWVVGSAELPEYPPVERYKLALELEGKRELVAGSSGVVTFSVTNTDTVPVRIPEWFVRESDNINLYCQPWLPGMEVPDEEWWLLLEEPVDEKEKTGQQDDVRSRRFPLELHPDNKVLISRTLPFVKVLNISPDGERRYFLKAELNLKSVKVSCPVAVISIHSPEAKAAK